MEEANFNAIVNISTSLYRIDECDILAHDKH